jgi:hypothetical protein
VGLTTLCVNSCAAGFRPTLRASSWLRDLTEEGIEPNPGMAARDQVLAWVQLRKGPIDAGGVHKVRVDPGSDVDDLRKRVWKENKSKLQGIDANDLTVYGNLEVLQAGKALDPGDPVPFGTTSKAPLYVVAPDDVGGALLDASGRGLFSTFPTAALPFFAAAAAATEGGAAAISGGSNPSSIFRVHSLSRRSVPV